jgi:hypothetical protein
MPWPERNVHGCIAANTEWYDCGHTIARLQCDGGHVAGAERPRPTIGIRTMAKIVESKSGKRYIVLEDKELTEKEKAMLEAVLVARTIERDAVAALREGVLGREEFKGKGLTVYVDWGKIKVTKAGEEKQTKVARPTLSLADALAAAELDGIAH